MIIEHFLEKANPQLDAFEELQKTYTKIDNVQFAVEPKPGAMPVPFKY